MRAKKVKKQRIAVFQCMTKDRYTKILNFPLGKGNLQKLIYLNWNKWVEKVKEVIPNVKVETIKFKGTVYD